MHSSRFILLSVFFLFSSISLFAQSDRKTEFFVGYSNLQAQGLPDKNNVTGIFSSDFLNDRSTLHGFATEVNGFLSGNFGLTGSFSFNENKQSNATFLRSDSVKTDILYFMGGPTFKVGNSSRFQPFVRVLAGGAHTRFDVNSERTFASGALTNSFNTHTTDFAMGAGGGLDWRVKDKFKVRLFQVDYAPVFLSDQSVRRLTDAGAIEPVTLNGQRMDNFRFVFGVVF
jgi:opacity protein-like surface antigen